MRDCPSYNLKYRIRYVLVKERYCLGSAHTAAKPHKPLFHSRIKLFVRVAANRHPESPVSIHRHSEPAEGGVRNLFISVIRLWRIPQFYLLLFYF
jgi:hypothetical protein